MLRADDVAVVLFRLYFFYNTHAFRTDDAFFKITAMNVKPSFVRGNGLQVELYIIVDMHALLLLFLFPMLGFINGANESFTENVFKVLSVTISNCEHSNQLHTT